MLCDIGLNLTDKRFAADRDAVVDRALAAGVGLMILTGTGAEVSEKAAALAAERPGVLYSTAGVHPHSARLWNDATAALLTRLYTAPQVVAVGECGLDYNRDFSPRPDQRKAFAAQLEMAVAAKLPVFLHARDAHDDMMAMLTEYRPHLVGGVVHCFTDGPAEAEAYLGLDLDLGITGWVCDERRGGALRDAVPRIPAGRLMIETDAPYLVPRDLRPRPKKGRNAPEYLPHIAAAVAALRGESVEQLAATTTANARRLFGLEATAA